MNSDLFSSPLFMTKTSGPTVRAEGMPLTIAVRIPDWSSGYTISGIEMSDIKEEKDGYIYVEKEWGEEDTFKINFTMKVRLHAAEPAGRQARPRLA